MNILPIHVLLIVTILVATFSYFRGYAESNRDNKLTIRRLEDLLQFKDMEIAELKQMIYVYKVMRETDLEMLNADREYIKNLERKISELQ